MIRNKKLVGITAGVMAVAAVTATWAFYTATHEIDNAMSTGEYGDVLTEKFAPDYNWEPGQEADKIVGVTNTGDYDIVVRIAMSESWTDANGDVLIAIAQDGDLYDATAAEGDQVSAIDGTVTGDSSVVAKSFLENNGWVFNSADGYWYYSDVLASGDVTDSLLTAITLSEDTDMGVYEETVYYYTTTDADAVAPDADSTSWIELPSDKELADVVEDGEYLFVRSESNVTDATGYSSADYILTITSETLQATEEAVATWTSAPDDIVTGWGFTVSESAE